MDRPASKKRLIKAVTAILVIITIIFLIKNRRVIHSFRNIKHLLEFLQHEGKKAIMIVYGIFALKPLVVIFPAAVMSVACGIIWGPFAGFLINMSGFFISGTIAFCIARILGRDMVDKILKEKALKFEYKLEKKGFMILLLLRLPPILPYDPLSYACGLTNIRYRDFITASLIGVIPETLCYSIMGCSILNPYSPKFIVPIILLIVSTSISGILFKKAKHIDTK